MATPLVRRTLSACLLAVLLLVFTLPIALYEIGLSNIEGRPIPPTQNNDLSIDTTYLQQAFHKREPLSIRVFNPWSYAANVLRNTDPILDDGSIAAWVIARDYNGDHLKNRRMTLWHISGGALTIWISRHWTSAQIVTAAASITRSRPNPHVIARSGRS
jgi:hypothetical protein